jgi:hypothetical protein
MDNEEASVGLCATCLQCRRVPSARATFYLCERSFQDSRYRKYPPLPVIRCHGYEAVVEAPPPDRDEPRF